MAIFWIVSKARRCGMLMGRYAWFDAAVGGCRGIQCSTVTMIVGGK